ncbi:hypothetical protein V6N13_108389 [Hibiscus sabdariffa]
MTDQWNLAFLKLGFYLTNYNGYSLEHVEGTKIGGSIFDVWGIRHTSTDLLKATNLKNVVGNATETIVKGTRFMKSDGSTDQTYEAYLNQPKNYRVVFTGTQTMTEICGFKLNHGLEKTFSANEEHSLQFFPPLSKDGEVSVIPSPDVFDDGISRILPELFTRIGLSYIASAIGVPLYMDSITDSRQRVAFAKVCVELPADAIIPKFVKVQIRDGSFVSIAVDVPWLLPRCSYCCTFGHAGKSCPHNATAGGLCEKGAKVEDKVQEAAVGVVLGESTLDLTRFEGVNFTGGDPSREVLAGPEGVVLGPAIGAGAIEVVSEVRDKVVLGDSTHRAVLLNSIGKAVASGANMDLTKSNGVSSGGGDPSRGILAGAEGVVQGPAVRAGANEVVSEDRAEIVLGDAT